MHWVMLTSLGTGEQVAVNMDQLSELRPLTDGVEEGAIIRFGDAHWFQVRESVNTILRMC